MPEPLPVAGLGPANWVDHDNNWRKVDGDFLQYRSILRYDEIPATGQPGQVVFDQALAALRFWPGTTWHNVLTAQYLKVYPGTGTEVTLGHTGAAGGGLVFESTRISSTLPFSGPSNAVTLDGTGLKVKTGASNVDALLSTNVTDLVINRPVNAQGVKTTTLTASGAVTITGALNAASLVLTTNASIAGTLGVTGQTTLAGVTVTALSTTGNIVGGAITAAGVMHADAFLQDNATQSSLAYSSARKDYVDAQVATKMSQATADGRYLLNTSDTLSGNLVVTGTLNAPVISSTTLTIVSGTGGTTFNGSAASAIFQTNGTERGRAWSSFMWGKSTGGIDKVGVELFESGVVYSTTNAATTPNVQLRHTVGSNATGQSFIQFQALGTILSNISQESVTGIKISNCTTVASSDYRWKNNLGPVKGALDRVMQLKLRELEWIESGQRFEGVIAHEAGEVLPYLVYGEKDALTEDGQIDGQGFNYSGMVTVLAAAIQELALEVRGAA